MTSEYRCMTQKETAERLEHDSEEKDLVLVETNESRAECMTTSHSARFSISLIRLRALSFCAERIAMRCVGASTLKIVSQP
jgi:hypothetical protein